MINYQFFPRSMGVTPRIREIIDCFKKVDEMKRTDAQLKSNEMLALLRPHLEKIDFKVEKGKAAGEQIFVPVLFSENDTVDKSFAADALSNDHKIVIEVEAGRAVFNNQFLKDIFQACMMYEVEYLVLAVLNEHVYKPNGTEKILRDYQSIKTFLETLYVSNRLRLPLKGILLIGY
ncbi:MAG: hypothetical protein ACI3X6_08390 [Alloprevotella sp.]